MLALLGEHYGTIEPMPERGAAPCRRLGRRDAGLIRAGWEGRRDRGAEERKAHEWDGLRVGGLIDIEKLREDPHLEMHARGG